MTFDDLKAQIKAGVIDTVLTCIVDMQGRLMGQRFHAEAFLEMAEDETHCCNYLLTVGPDALGRIPSESVERSRPIFSSRSQP